MHILQETHHTNEPLSLHWRGKRQAEQLWSLVCSSVRMTTVARLATTDSTSSPITQVLAANAPAL